MSNSGAKSLVEWFHPIEDEYCMPDSYEGSLSSFLDYNIFIVQLLLVSFFSTVANTYVVYHHWTAPPHPKFELLLDRKISIRLHVLAGTIEIISSFIAFFAKANVRDAFVYIQVFASFVHSATALYQLPIVFGVQLVMIPAYIMCVFMKIYCAIDLFINPLCALKVIRLYNILSIYTWCRVILGVLWSNFIMTEYAYTISIVLAGMICVPSMGICMNMFLFIGLCVCILIFKVFLSDGHFAFMASEHPRDMFDTPKYQASLMKYIGLPSGCPFSRISPEIRTNALRDLFNMFDKDGSQTISVCELIEAGGWTEKEKKEYAKMGQKEMEMQMDFDHFQRFFQTRGVVDILSHQANVRNLHLASFDEKAAFIFSMIDDDGGGTISFQELARFLKSYSLPFSDVVKVLVKADDSLDGALDLLEFKTFFKALINFQVEELSWALTRMSVQSFRNEVKASYVEEKAVKVQDAWAMKAHKGGAKYKGAGRKRDLLSLTNSARIGVTDEQLPVLGRRSIFDEFVESAQKRRSSLFSPMSLKSTNAQMKQRRPSRWKADDNLVQHDLMNEMIKSKEETLQQKNTIAVHSPHTQAIL